MIHQVMLYGLVLAMLYLLWGGWQRMNRCSYCGRVAAHDDDCPYGRA